MEWKPKEKTEFERARDNHYDKHSRHIAMTVCNQPECIKASKERSKEKKR